MKKIFLGALLIIVLAFSVISFSWDYSSFRPIKVFKIEPVVKSPYIFTNGVCGNMKIEIGEQCDPKMQPISPTCPDTAKFCNEKCQCQTLCGNGIIEPGEECDGQLNCNPITCTFGPIRGENFLFR